MVVMMVGSMDVIWVDLTDASMAARWAARTVVMWVALTDDKTAESMDAYSAVLMAVR